MSGKPERNITSMENDFTKQQQVKEKISARKRKLLIRRLTVFILIAGAISYFLISDLVSKNQQLAGKRTDQVKLEKQAADLKKEKSMLKDQVNKLNDDNYIAKLARSEYFLSKKGEIIFNIPKSKQKKSDEDVSY